MITVVIPTLNAESGLAAALTALVPATVDGLIREVIIVDGGSTDRTLDIADQAGATIVRSASGRGQQLAAGAREARMPWLLFLHADAVLEPGWEREAFAFIERVEAGQRPEGAAAFRFALDDLGLMPRILEAAVSLRCALMRMPCGDQGLLISQRLYSRIGGYRELPAMEDLDIVQRLGRSRTTILRARAVTNAFRFRQEGYARQSMKSLTRLLLYSLRIPSRLIARISG